MDTLLPLYVFAAVLGAVLLVFSLGFGGETDADADLDADLGADGAEAGETDAAHADAGGLFATLVSLRFWTFFATFFGVTGLLFEGLGVLASPVASAVVSAAVGFAAGQVVVRVLRHLARPAGGEVPDRGAYLGKTGRVLVPITPGGLGKVRIELAGRTVDVSARTEDDAPIAAGTTVLLVEMRDQTAIVEPYDDSEPTPTGSTT